MNEPLRVVIVEDEAVVLMQLQFLLEDAGHHVVGTAMTTQEALAVIDRECPELVLIDIQLRDGTSGLDVARAVRDYEDLTLVFITANVRKLAADFDGAAAVIAKPFNERTLEGSLAYLEECVHRPPPKIDLPAGMTLAPAFSARMDGLRTAL